MLGKCRRRARPGRDRSQSSHSLSPAIERLEELSLLSASSVLAGIQASPRQQVAPAVTNTVPRGHTPAEIQQAYGFNQIWLKNGTVRGDGAGQTIAIVDAYTEPNIANDLKAFDKKFGLPAPPKFTIYAQKGAKANADWGLEIALDVEWAHAMAPKANILLVEAKSNSLSDLLAAVDYARKQKGVSVVSMSWGSDEFFSESAYDGYFTTPANHPGVTFVASSGDDGAGSSWPSASPNVLSVGGTSLSTLSGGTYVDETVWDGSGGGVSDYENEPNWQMGLQLTGHRSTPDVAYDADPHTGFAVYDTLKLSGQTGWFQVGGTSAGAPQWAALFAIANQGRAYNGLPSLANGQAAIYELSPVVFHDVTLGSTGNPALVGYDLATGRGTPYAYDVVAGLSLLNDAASSGHAVVAAGTESSSARQSFAIDASASTTTQSAAADAVLADFSISAFVDSTSAVIVYRAPALVAVFASVTANGGQPAITSTLGESWGIGRNRVAADRTAESPAATVATSHDFAEAFNGSPKDSMPEESMIVAVNAKQADACFADDAWIADQPVASTAAVADRGGEATPSLAAAWTVMTLWGVRSRKRARKPTPTRN